MRTPPTTRTKDDANKELHDLEILINKEKAKLEIVSKERADREPGLVAREEKCRKTEEKSKEIVEKIEADIAIKKEELLNTEHFIKVNNNLILSQKNDISDNDKEINKQSKNISSLRILNNKEVTSRKKILSELDTDIKCRSEVIKDANKEMVALKKSLIDIKKEIKESTKEVELEKKKLAEREIIIANKNSDLRIIGDRLNRKYKGVASELELKLINK